MPLLRALDWGEAGELSATAISIVWSCEDRSIVRQPLHAVRRMEGAEAALYALHHHIPDHLA